MKTLQDVPYRGWKPGSEMVTIATQSESLDIEEGSFSLRPYISSEEIISEVRERRGPYLRNWIYLEIFAEQASPAYYRDQVLVG